MSTVRASLARLLPAGSASTSKTLTLFPALVAPRGCRLSRSFIGNSSSQPFATSPLAFATASNNDSNPQDPYKQTDQNAPDLKQRVDELVKLIKSVGPCMLTSRAPDSEALHSRAMYPTSTKDLTFTFFANAESGKHDGIKKDSHVNLAFYHPDNSWISVAGEANVSKDRQKIKELWSPATQAWFNDQGTEGHHGDENDARVELIEVVPTEIRYFVKTKGPISKVVDIATSAVTGGVAQPGKLRVLSGSELRTARALVKE